MSKKLKILFWFGLLLFATYVISLITVKSLNSEEIRTANAEMLTIHTALKLFKLDVERYPTKEEGLEILWDTKKGLALRGYKKSGYSEPIKAPWGNKYQYLIDEESGQPVKLWTLGNPSNKDELILDKYTQ